MRLLVLVLALAGCTKAVETRVCNHTGYAITRVVYDDHKVGALADGACSPYVIANGDVYENTSVRFMVDAEDVSYDLFSIDHLKDKPLSAGRWTYELRFQEPGARKLITNAVKD